MAVDPDVLMLQAVKMYTTTLRVQAHFLGMVHDFMMRKWTQNSCEQRVRAIRNALKEKLKRSREMFEAERRADLRCRRRRRLLLVSQFALVSDRKMWRRERPHGPVFWSNVLNNFDEDEWRGHFRMSRATFDFVLELVEPQLRRKTTNWRQPLEPRLRLAIALWWYATPCEYRSISCIFGVGVATVCVLVRQVTGALSRALSKRFVQLPSGARLQEAMHGFAERGYPMCAGAIHGTHIPIRPPPEDPLAYSNQKGWHSIVLQAVVDHNQCFTDVYVGWPGRTHDAQVLANSPISRKAEDQGGYLFPREKSKTVNGVEIPVHLIGDQAYPLRNWLMKGFTNHHLFDQRQQSFNLRLNSARMVVENALRRLKGRWRCLAKRLDICTSFVSDVVVACCVLHNICEINKEHFLPEWNTELPDLPEEPERVANQDAQAQSHQAIREAIMSLL
ncbi:putative nuclease HARBI1 [Narcine bancroftii]|uniref:putative nuclease HARBI1 n=1 Tax=Narcine bancroftii TaxID=1343680 RepID=UPI00383132E1